MMKTEVEIEAEEADKVGDAVSPSLENDDGVKVEVENKQERVRAKIQAKTFGRLRGGTDATFRLTGVAKKIIER